MNNMELLYIWINQYRHIIDQEFYFSREFVFEIDPSNKEFLISKSNENNIQLFNDTFINITAIIGKNGSGKSTLFSFLKSLFSDNFFQYQSYILVLKLSSNSLLVIDKLSNSSINLSIRQRKEIGISIEIEKNTDRIQALIDLIFFSNSFCVYETEPYRSNYSDFSFNKYLDDISKRSNEFLIERYNSLLERYEHKTKNKDFLLSKKILIDSSLPSHLIYNYDIFSNINFVLNYKNENWDFIPKKISISFNHFFISNNNSYFQKLGLKESLDNIKHFISKQEYNDTTQTLSLFQDRIVVSLFLYYTIHIQYYEPKNVILLKDFIKHLSEYGDYENTPAKIKSFFINEDNKLEDELYDKISEFVKSLGTRVSILKNDIDQYSSSLSFYVSAELESFLKEIYDLWRNKDFIFLFDWQGLSAGESALLNLFSKIMGFSESQHPDYTKDVFWILIDEGDLYLHPEWQRNYLSDLHKYLPQFFKGKQIQLFITSHSPFVISDLPRQNTILLNKVKGRCEVVDSDEFDRTFGANIHELYTKSFFLDKGLIGEFAKNKIQDAIRYLKHNSLNPESELNPKPIEDWDRNKVKDLISIVGEPLISERLQKLYDEKYKSREEIKREILRLRKLLDDKK
jgi:predicted ATP-dependent endonuclease of OLD family